MKWTQIDADGDPGQTFAADAPGGVLVQTISSAGVPALAFLPATSVAVLTATPPPAPPSRVDPSSLNPNARALWDRIAAVDPRVTELTPDQFDLVKIGVQAGTE